MPNSSRPLYIVSACLIGLCTRYDGRIKENPACLEMLRDAIWIPVCPEQLGGLPTPREAADISGGNGDDVLTGRAKVMTKSGVDVSQAFIRGAAQALSIARSQPVRAVLLKANSPSCGRNGVTACLLRQHGFQTREF
jgi:uncharacterized protein YbbK (DUF523 family)